MARPKLFDVKHQLIFYGAYHSNKTNVAIHICCVPLIIWSTQVFLSSFQSPSFLSTLSIPSFQLGQYLTFEPNWAVVFASLYWLYYFSLEPVAALLYAPQSILSTMFATYFSKTPHGVQIAAWVHVCSWVAQFIGHGVYEGRAPALLDNLLGAVVLAPFFVHLELLFMAGYNKKLNREVTNGIGMEIKRFRTEEKAKKAH